MKKTLLILNNVFYAIMYHLGWFLVGFSFGDCYQLGELLWDGNIHYYDNCWPNFLYPVFFLVFFLVGLYLAREHKNLSVKALMFWGGLTWIPSGLNFLIAYFFYYEDGGTFLYKFWFLLGVFILASVIFVFDIICAIQTFIEHKTPTKKI